jgi:hypothetical protein
MKVQWQVNSHLFDFKLATTSNGELSLLSGAFDLEWISF